MAVCAAGAGTGYVLYNRAAQPDRSTPSVAVRRYVDAAFNTRDASAVRKFTCGDPSGITQSQDLLKDITAREAAHAVKINVSVDGIEAHTSGSASTVTAHLRLGTVVAGRAQEQIQNWEFSLRKRSAWLVCDARRTG